jgi:hypothetical protein
VLLSKASNINIFGYYKITSLEPWIPNPNFFVVEVDFISGNGFIFEDLDYLVSLVDKVSGSGDAVWGSITGDIEDQTDLINYISSQITPYTVNNGLTESPANNFQLGGTLINNTTIDNASLYNLSITGSLSGNSLFKVDNSVITFAEDASTKAITGQAISGIGVFGNSSDNYGVYGNSKNSIGVKGISTNNYSISGTGNHTTAGYFQVDNNTAGVLDVIKIARVSSGFQGVGFSLETNVAGGTTQVSNRFRSIFTDTNFATRTSQLQITSLNNAVESTTFTLKGTGQLQLDKYTGTTFDASPTKSLGVDASGNVITFTGGGGGGTVTSIGLTVPSAFNVNPTTPITTSGTFAITGAGLVSQYVRGDGTLANFPNSTSGGSSLSFYLNGSVSQGTIGGVAFREMDRTPILGAGTDFTINANGYIQSFITDANVPNLLEIPAGNWNFETYFSASSGGGSPSFYVELYKWNGTTLSLIASNSATPRLITDGTNIEAYFSALAVPQTTLLATDRLAIRIYVTHSGRTITLHTENSHLCQVITTFSTGLTALNGLTAQVQNLEVGTTGTDFAISSSTATHTFNLPTASASNRGALSSTDWSTFNNKQNALGFTAEDVANKQTDLTASATKYPTVNAVNTGLALKQNILSYTPYKFIQTSQTVHTGTTSETNIFTATIPANSFNSQDVIKVLFGINKPTSLGGYTLRLRLSTTNNPTGGTLIALYTGGIGLQSVIITRNYNLNGGNLYGVSFPTTILTDQVATNVLSSTPLNPANQFFIHANISLANAGDSINISMLSIKN